MNNQNFAIGILSVTAVILLVGLVVMGTLTQQQVRASGMNDRSGDYVLLTSEWRSGRELLWVLDARSEVLGMYYFDPQVARLGLYGKVFLARGPR